MKIISGGQTGADIAGLKVAKKYEIQTGGYMPKGYKTLEGNKPEYKDTYSMKETNTPYYGYRTELNARESDCTIWFGENKKSSGRTCTFNAIKKHNKPHMDIDINKFPSIDQVVEWITTNKYNIINIAGNSETTTPGIEKIASTYMDQLFAKLQLIDKPCEKN